MKKGMITQIEPTLKEAAPSFISSRKLGVISSPAMNKITIADSSPLSESSQEKQEAFHQKMVEHLMHAKGPTKMSAKSSLNTTGIFSLWKNSANSIEANNSMPNVSTMGGKVADDPSAATCIDTKTLMDPQ